MKSTSRTYLLRRQNPLPSHITLIRLVPPHIDFQHLVDQIGQIADGPVHVVVGRQFKLQFPFGFVRQAQDGGPMFAQQRPGRRLNRRGQNLRRRRGKLLRSISASSSTGNSFKSASRLRIFFSTSSMESACNASSMGPTSLPVAAEIKTKSSSRTKTRNKRASLQKLACRA